MISDENGDFPEFGEALGETPIFIPDYVKRPTDLFSLADGCTGCLRGRENLTMEKCMYIQRFGV